MNIKKKLEIKKFQESPLTTLEQSRQVKYLYSYLEALDASSVLIEHNYFDRDYLSEFSAFYGISTKGYSNVCKRVHFFKNVGINRNILRRACSGNKRTLKNLQNDYLGFSIIRPIPAAPLGRTVLSWFLDENKNLPRVTNPSRTYTCNVAGIKLVIDGLAWQQQDTGVGACATVCLCSLLHSSAFDDNHAVSRQLLCPV